MPLKKFDLDVVLDEIDGIGMKHWLLRQLALAYKEARKNKIKTFNEHQYEANWTDNLQNLCKVIYENAYLPSSSLAFIIFDPMIREIFAAQFVDRIVHHLLYTICGKWWDARMIYDSFSCRDGKGTLLGIQRLQKMMRQASDNGHKKAIAYKMDIRGYFMSLPRKELYKVVKWGLDRQFEPYMHRAAARKLKQLCEFLWKMVLMDDPARKARKREPLSNWNKLPLVKSLFYRLPGVGIVIGNLTSQLVSNIYLSTFDRYIKFTLKYKYYVRYVDDFVIVVPEEDYKRLLKDIEKIERFLRNVLHLTLHPDKRYVQDVRKGVNCLGARVYLFCVYPSNRLQKKFRREIKKFLESGGKERESLTSYMGLMKHMNGDGFVKKVFDEYGLDFKLYLESKSEERRGFDVIFDELAVGAKL